MAAAPEGVGGVFASFLLGFAEEESMEAESWSRIAAPPRRHQNALQSRFDLYMGFEKVDGGEEDPRAEFPCPFCAEEFDMVALCCHIDDEHPVATTKGVCPICEDRVSMDMLGHIMMLHGNYFKISFAISYFL
ncbi:hypothetical protein Taro_044758 [Colocasia esculenta]|uniref:Di19 zinc-binding domain-containing protein n=1 Tax=Colocasia esculenta TaxID=4460 RepID=A0A843X3R8_COLES|nr:hypothetical protein [Colocasia esculenta]